MDRGPTARLAFDEKQAAMGHDDPVADGEPQAGPSSEGAEEGIEHLRQRFCGNAAAIVGQGDVPTGLLIQFLFNRRQDDARLFRFLQGADGVLKQVLRDLAQQIGIAPPGGPRGDLVLPGNGFRSG